MLKDLNSFLIILTAIALAFLLALWISLVIWTVRDIKIRTKDKLLRLLAAFSVVFFSFPGFLLYLILRPRYTFTEYYQAALEEEALLQSIEGFDVCSKCGHQTKQSWYYCPYCENRLSTECANCGEYLKPDWRICPFCATPVNNTGAALNQDNSNETTESASQQVLSEDTNNATFDFDGLSLEEEEFDSFQEN